MTLSGSRASNVSCANGFALCSFDHLSHHNTSCETSLSAPDTLGKSCEFALPLARTFRLCWSSCDGSFLLCSPQAICNGMRPIPTKPSLSGTSTFRNFGLPKQKPPSSELLQSP